MFASLEGGKRRPLDRALSGRAFSIDELACAAGAKVLRALRIETDRAESTRVQESELLFKLAQSAICHQINWDFLAERLGSLFDDPSVGAESLRVATARDVDTWLAGYHRPERVKATERAALLRDLGNVILHNYGGKAVNLFISARQQLYGTDGLLKRLDGFQAFREDPLKKKSNILVHEIVRDGVATFLNSEHIAPAIDYHIMRLYLRTGRVVPVHRETMDVLKQDSMPRQRLVTLLREAVSEALRLTALYSNLSIPEVNAFEWQIGREACDRRKPRCSVGNELFNQQFGFFSDACLYSGFCLAYADENWRMLREPDLRKSFY